MSGDWSAATRQLVADRSENRCERCGLARAVHIHHRLLRRYGNHTPSNALHVCWSCHDFIHGHVIDAMHRGWLIAGSAQNVQNATLSVPNEPDPATVAVFYRGETVLLGNDGFILIPAPRETRG